MTIFEKHREIVAAQMRQVDERKENVVGAEAHAGYTTARCVLLLAQFAIDYLEARTPSPSQGGGET